MLAHVAASTWTGGKDRELKREGKRKRVRKSSVRTHSVFRAVVVRRNLSDEKRVSRISSGDFHGPRKIHCIRLMRESPSVRPSVRLGEAILFSPFPYCPCAHT